MILRSKVRNCWLTADWVMKFCDAAAEKAASFDDVAKDFQRFRYAQR